MQHPERQPPMARPHPTPQKHHLRLRSEINLHTSTSYISTCFHAISHESDASRFHPKPSPKVSPNGSGLSALLRTAADVCGTLRTVADGCGRRNNGSRTRLYPQTPRVKREPFATHSGKTTKSLRRWTGHGVFWFGPSTSKLSSSAAPSARDPNSGFTA